MYEAEVSSMKWIGKMGTKGGGLLKLSWDTPNVQGGV